MSTVGVDGGGRRCDGGGVQLSDVIVGVLLTLRRRQKRQYNLRHPPHELKDHIKPETFKKAQLYGKDKLTYSIGKIIFNWLLSTSLINWGAYPYLWDATGNLLDKFGYDSDEYVVSVT